MLALGLKLTFSNVYFGPKADIQGRQINECLNQN